jgi:hypothetical protein
MPQNRPRKPLKASPQEQAGAYYEPCVVSFIDVLGFRDVLKTQPADKVYRIITSLQKFTRSEDEPARSMDEVRLYSRAFSQAVSDAVIRVRPFDTKYHDGALIHELIDLLHAQLELVNIGLLVRGGVTVGTAYAGLNGEGPIFGPAMVRAYEIESQEAIYPRIVVDDYAIEQHRVDRRLHADHNLPEHEFDMIERLLAVGEDGTLFIDYIRAAQSECEYLSVYLEFLNSHADLIRKASAKNQDIRVKRKYEWLRRYHNACVEPMRDATLSSKKKVQEFLAEFETSPKSYFNRVIL